MKIYLMKDGDWVLFENPSKAEFESRNIAIGARSRIGEGSAIETSLDCIVLGPIGSRGAMMTAYVKDKVIQIGTGCFIGPIDEFEKRVKEVHSGNKFEKQYSDALDYIRAKFKEKML